MAKRRKAEVPYQPTGHYRGQDKAAYLVPMAEVLPDDPDIDELVTAARSVVDAAFVDYMDTTVINDPDVIQRLRDVLETVEA